MKKHNQITETDPTFTQSLVYLLIALIILAYSGGLFAADLRVMKTGLGKGSIQGPGISCGIVAHDVTNDVDTVESDCNISSTTAVELTVTTLTGSTFTGWGGDCTGTGACNVDMSSMASVRANFTLNTVPTLTTADLTPSGIHSFLTTGAGTTVNTQAEFVAALPAEFRENWIHMTRSESLQTGTGDFPRILLVSENAEQAFTLGLAEHSSYPGSHPNAIEYMQWNDRTKNFHFHEIVLEAIPGMDEINPGPPAEYRFKPRPNRQVTEDDPKCFACHSTRNVENKGTTPGTTGMPVGSVKFKSKPNWDTYDSWGGMLGFNRDRIYKGSIEAATFRNLMNLWTWQTNEDVRAVIEQLELQPAWIDDGAGPERLDDRIERWDTPTTQGGANDGHIRFNFDPPFPTVANEPLPTATEGPSINYTFDRSAPNATPSTVARNDEFVVLQHSRTGTGTRFGQDEGRGTAFFNNLYLDLNPQRIVSEISPESPATNIFATGGVPIDVRPIALAIAEGCIRVNNGVDPSVTQIILDDANNPLSVPAFFADRNGLDFDDVFDDTRARAVSMSRRKADIQKLNLDRTGDEYVDDAAGATPVTGLIDMHIAKTAGLVPATEPGSTASLRLRQLRQEIFRRPAGTTTLDTADGLPLSGFIDRTAMNGHFVDREEYNVNTQNLALYRFFLEPLGVSVDRWSLGVRGRSRTYSFADQFNITDSYDETFRTDIAGSLGVTGCAAIMPLVTAEFARLPGAADTPPYTDVQRIFNKSCIECHGGLNYPPARNYSFANFDFSENENPPAGESKLWKPLSEARAKIGAPSCLPSQVTCTSITAANLSTARIYQRITDGGNLVHPYDPSNIAGSNEDCPNGVMPCGGPPLSKTDIETIKRWIVGSAPNTEGDPHIRTVDGVNYDFQSAGEFVLLRDAGMELQARQSAVTTAGPLGANAHTGLSSCVSVNTAVAMRVGDHRVTYQPNLANPNDEVSSNNPDLKAPHLQLRIDGKPTTLGEQGIALRNGGRIIATNDAGGLEVQYPGGTRIAVTPSFWQRHQIHFMHVNVYHARAVDGIMGAIAPNNWLPRLSNGDFLGPRPASLAQRHQDLYETFADSWRVDASNSLFHYEPGLSHESFLVPGWPVSAAQNCLAPAQPGVPIPTAPITPMAQAQAEQHCAGLDDPQRFDNCVQDVMATGDAVFAASYQQSQALDQRILIAPPQLNKPADNAELPAGQVDFEWAPVPGTEVIDVTHYHCLWKSNERFDFNQCTVLGTDGSPLDEYIPPTILEHLSPMVCIVLLLALLLLAIILYLANRRKLSLWVIVLALLLALVCWIHHHYRADEPTSTRIESLIPGEVYRWKVVTETKAGLITESETRRFEIKE